MYNFSICLIINQSQNAPKTVPSISHTKYMSKDNVVSDYQLKADCKIDDYF